MASRHQNTGYYAVARGRQPGVYVNWDEAAQQVLGFPGAIYQWFAELADAQAFVAAYRNDRADHYWGPDRSEDKPRFN